MAKFIFKFGRETETREGDRVSVGTRSTASFTLADPLAADFHCDIIVRGPEFVVMDSGGTLGTFVNGIRIVEAHPLADGDQIVCAVTRLNVSIKGDELTLNQDRSRFYYDDKKDGLDLSRREVAFGRFRPVSVGNWIVVFIMLLLFPLCYLGTTSDVLLEPGETWHGAQGAYHTALMGLTDSDQDCSACHDPFSGTPATKCLTCHQDDIGPQDMHPFYATAEEWGESCIKCHIDHRGTDHGALISRPAKDSCGDCHADGIPEAKVRPSTIARVDVGVTYNTFAHSDHMAKDLNGRKLDCSDCHKAYSEDVAKDDRVEEGDRKREFVPVDYQTCLACHAGNFDKVPNFESKWHGTEDDGKNCLTCHGAVNEAAMRQVDYFPATRGFTLAGRSHEEEMRAAESNGGQKCADCHKNEEQLQGGRKFEARRFAHVTHVLELNPLDNAQKMILSGSADNPQPGQCATCHSDMVQSDSLAQESPHHYANESCAKCHTAGAVVEKADVGDRMKRNEFPHGRHDKIEGGCFACHTFVDNDPKRDVMTPPDVQDCSKCHKEHRAIGGGHCADCHKPKDAVYSAKPLPWERRPDKNFSHTSSGHREWTEQQKCADCHGEEIWKTKTIDAITIPVEDDPKCRDCHVKERFHRR